MPLAFVLDEHLRGPLWQAVLRHTCSATISSTSRAWANHRSCRWESTIQRFCARQSAKRDCLSLKIDTRWPDICKRTFTRAAIRQAF
jgi:hypothetical protein